MKAYGQGGRKRKRSVLSIQAAEHKNACAVGNVSRFISRLPQTEIKHRRMMTKRRNRKWEV